MQNNFLKKRAELWIRLCDNDLHSAQVEFTETKHYTLVGFLCQQATEKYLKSFLMLHGISIEKKLKTHNLIFLLAHCDKIDNDFNDWEEELKFLNDFYIDTRYPADHGQISLEKEARKCIKYTEQFVKFIKNKINLL